MENFDKIIGLTSGLTLSYNLVKLWSITPDPTLFLIISVSLALFQT